MGTTRTAHQLPSLGPRGSDISQIYFSIKNFKYNLCLKEPLNTPIWREVVLVGLAAYQVVFFIFLFLFF